MPTALIEEYVQSLDRRLAGPRRLKRDLLAEARDSLVDATEAYESAGLASREAAARAVAEFGAPGLIARAYQRELAAVAGRRLALLVMLFPVFAKLFGDRMWQGSPWADATTVPAGYLVLARAVDWTTPMLGILALGVLVALWRQARTGADPIRLCRAVGLGTVAALVLTTGLGVAIWVFTVLIWPAALTWPPMIAGGAVLSAVFAVQLVSAVRCLRVTRATPVPAGAARPETC